MALYKKLDLWSISDGLDKMMDYCYNGNVKDSPYWDYYCDQINELCNMASDLYVELQDVKSRLWYQMPAKRLLSVTKMTAARRRPHGSTLRLQCCPIPT